MPSNARPPRDRSNRAVPADPQVDGTDSGHGSGPLSVSYVAEMARIPRTGSSRRVEAPANIAQLEVRRSTRVASRAQSSQQSTQPTVFIPPPPGTKKAVGYVYEALPSLHDESPSLHNHAVAPSDPPGNVDDFRGIAITQASLERGSSTFMGRKRSATSDAHRSPRQGHGPQEQQPTSPTHRFEAPFQPNPTTPPRSNRSAINVAPASSPIQSNPLLQRPISSDLHATSPGRSRSLSHCTCDSHAAWAAAEGLLPISEAFQTPGYVPAHIVGGITYSVRSPRSAQFRPAGQEADIQASADYPVALPTPSGPQRLPSERIQNESMHAPAYTPFPQRAHSFTPSSRFHDQLRTHPIAGDGISSLFPDRQRGSGGVPLADAPQVSTATHLPSPANTITSSHLRELACHQLSHWEVAPEPPFNSASSRPLGSHPAISPDLLAAIASALGSTASPYVPNPESSQPVRKFFSRTITNTTSELPIAVIKELRSGFKSYIPLALCTHKACSNATRSSDAFDTEIGMNERGEIRLKQKTLTASKDYTISTDDFTEIRENFTR